MSEAANFFLRAYNVSKNAGDVQGASEAAELLANVYRKLGDEKRVEKVLKMKNEK